MSRTLALLVAVMLLSTAGSALADEAQYPDDDAARREHCALFPERCGASVVWGPDYAGVDNCRADPNCITRRIVHRTSGASDFIAVPDNTPASGQPGGAPTADPDGDSTSPADPGPVAPSCTPRAAGRVAPDFAQTSLPQGQIHVNPYHQQLTGLESWFWWQGDTTATWQSPVAVGIAADCSIIPAPAAQTHEATLVGFVWEIEDGRPATYTSHQPGSEQSPAVRHTYRTKGHWTATVACVWEGDWGERITVACGERDLEVIEVRTRLGNG